MRRSYLLGPLMLATLLAACGGNTTSQDLQPGTDLIVPLDQGGTDTPGDQGTPQDISDPGTPDTGSVDPGNPPDETPVDPGVSDETPVDPGIGDPGATDVPAPGDLPAADVPPFDCTGACDPATQSLQCMPDNLTICYCNPDRGGWEPYACADVCQANGMVGTACILGQNGQPTCDCSFDCSQPALVAQQCDDLAYTPCTCSALDPCGWKEDGYCDSACLSVVPEDPLQDDVDCLCEGACIPDEFSEFCDLDQNPCRCQEGQKVSETCTTYCGAQGAVVQPDEPCSSFWGMAFCNCQDWSCEDPEQIQQQCAAGSLTPCTCAVSNPCNWIGDGYCDSESCNRLYPDQQNFDDTAQDCQG